MNASAFFSPVPSLFPHFVLFRFDARCKVPGRLSQLRRLNLTASGLIWSFGSCYFCLGLCQSGPNTHSTHIQISLHSLDLVRTTMAPDHDAPDMSVMMVRDTFPITRNITGVILLVNLSMYVYYTFFSFWAVNRHETMILWACCSNLSNRKGREKPGPILGFALSQP